MKQLLYRGKTTKKKDNQAFNNVWVEGDLIKNKNKYYIHPHANVFKVENELAKLMVCHEVIPETVGQYTGLTDKNGTKIFEGDICRFSEWHNDDMCWVGKVHYEHQQFVISGDKNKECETSFYLALSCFISEKIEVIGNIHDNPELLEVKE